MSNYDPLARPDSEDQFNEELELNEEENVLEEQEEELSEEVKELGKQIKATPPIVEKAKKHGHLNKEQYIEKYGSADGYKDEEQFNKYGDAWGEVSDVIKGLQKKLEEQSKQTESLVKYNERVEDRAYQRARQQLEAQLQEAKNLGDVASVEHITKEKAKMEFQESQKVYQQHEQQRVAIENEFRTRNKHWFGINMEMTQFAKEKDAEIRAEAQRNNVPLTYESLARQLEAHLKATFPDQMIVNSKAAPTISSANSAIAKGSRNQGTESVDKVFNGLDQELKSVYAATKRIYEKNSNGKPYTKEYFINRLKKDGEI